MEYSTFAEDLPVGEVKAIGSYDITAEDILDFGRKWDPLPMHIDAELAASSGFGRLIASGIHSIGIAQRLLALGLYPGWAIYVGRGISDVRFLRPVGAGDHLVGEAIIVSVDFNKPDRALVTIQVWLTVDEVRVMQFDATFYVLRRPS
jgi:acyl dehydratase